MTARFPAEGVSPACKFLTTLLAARLLHVNLIVSEIPPVLLGIP